MKRKIKEDLQGKTAQQLKEELVKRQEELSKLRLELQTGKLKNTASIGIKADEIAVLKTLIRQDELRGKGVLK